MCSYIGTRDLVQEHIAFKFECMLSTMPNDQLADCLSYNNLKVGTYFLRAIFHEYNLQGLILNKALKVKKDAEDESTRIAFENLRSDVIELRHQAKEKDKNPEYSS